MNFSVFKMPFRDLCLLLTTLFFTGCAGGGIKHSEFSIINAQSMLLKGHESIKKSKSSEAVGFCGEAAEIFRSLENLEGFIAARLCQAQGYLDLGRHEKACEILIPCLKQNPKSVDKAALQGSLALAYQQSGQNELCLTYLEEAIKELRITDEENGLQIALLNSLGNLYFSKDEYVKSLASYKEALGLADELGIMPQGIQLRINIARAEFARGKYAEALLMLSDSLNHIPLIPDNSEKANCCLTIGRLLRQIRNVYPDASIGARIMETFESALKIADGLNDQTALSYAYGYMAMEMLDQRKDEEALVLFRKASFLAQKQGIIKSLYLWQWQSGKILYKNGELDDAILSYQSAIRSLREFRTQFSTGCNRGTCISFSESIQPVYFEMVDLLLKRSALSDDSDQVRADLIEARSTMEQLKTAEMENYFQDECVTALHAESVDIDRLDSKTVVIYPILLPDRIELIVSFPGALLKQFTVSVKRNEIEETVGAFRQKIQDPSSRPLRQAKILHDWLIAPFEKELLENGVQTLVFIPDGILRMIPLSALHDGNDYLIERYAIVTSPGLSLTEAHPMRRGNLRLLLSGISQAVHGYSPLPSVSNEIDTLKGLYIADVLKDEQFIVGRFESDLRNMHYPVVHIASHGQFDSNSKNTFILAYDEKIGMDRLEKIIRVSKYRSEPVELLTLSACETAKGDDKAALGLAGVALKAGARSALASLWFIDDSATSKLIIYFYKELQRKEVTKAWALQLAQCELIRHPEYQHPAYWASFLLIGNWF